MKKSIAIILSAAMAVSAVPQAAFASTKNYVSKIKSVKVDEAQEKYESLGGTPELDFGYTVFGQVFEGMDVVDAIAKTETDDNDKPKTDVVIEKIEITQY